MKRILIISLGLFLFLACIAFGQEIAITIYNKDLALVKDTRMLDFQKGKNEIKFTNVAAQIDPTSVHFKAVDSPDKVMILEQNYQFDLVSSDKILEKYVDKEIQIKTKGEKLYTGVLLSYASDNLTLKEKDGGIRIVSRSEVMDLFFPSLPEGLITQPTLLWWLESQIQGKQKAQVSYLTTGINWHAEYVGVVDEKDQNLEIAGWVSINNRSGATYKEAKMKLVAGEVHRVEERRVRPLLAKGIELEAVEMARPFEEKAFFEYHLYTLKRPATIKDKEIKQITLFPTEKVKVDKIFIYDGAREAKKVKVNLEFVNSQEQGLGIPLPEGKIRVYKEDVDKSLEFVGEDKIDHTPKNEKVRVYLGDAFDVVGERKRTDYKRISDDVWEESYEIKLRNHKKEAIEVTVVEHLLYYAEWEIIRSNFEYNKKDAQTIEYKIPVQPDEEKVITYTVRYVR
ncbi:MAG: DUF4139 domain-containing protein [Candidatus Zixiibacteriota bacterium]